MGIHSAGAIAELPSALRASSGIPLPGCGKRGLSTTVMQATCRMHTASPRGDPGNSSSSFIKRDPIASIFLSEIVSKLNISLERVYF